MTRTMIALSLVSVLAACGSSTPSPAPMPTPDPEPTEAPAPPAGLELFNQWAAAMEKKDYAAAGAFYADDATFQTGNNPQVITGRDNIAAMFKVYDAAFPDMENHVLEVVAGDKWVAAIVLTRGTNSGSLMGQPATNKRTSFKGMQVWTLDDAGKIKTAVAYADNLNFLGHLGMWQGEARPVDDGKPPARVDITGTADESTTAVADKLTAAIASRDPAAIAALYGADATLDDVSAAAPAVGTEAVTAYWTALFAAFPDLAYEGATAVTVGNRVVIRYQFVGTNSGDLARFGAKATNKKVTLVSADVLAVQDGKIVRHDIFMDGMSVGFVLGLIKF